MSIGFKIKKVRELRNYAQEYMAEKLVMSQAGYSKIERDEVDVNFNKLQQIADTLNIDVTKLIGFDEKNVFVNHGQLNLW
ncbi:MAG: XRE family transcriptional regulator [Bacteroidetes bacterium]|nr:MAG: XRE family transcriptional regulator [Bacteroidota bacterium]